MMIRAAGPQLHAEAGLAHGLLAAGRPGADPGGVVDVLDRVEAGAAEAGPALAVLRGVLVLGGRDLLGRDLEQDHVVDDRRGCRAHGVPVSHSSCGPARGRAGSSGSRRCRRRRAPRACTPPASPASRVARPRGAGPRLAGLASACASCAVCVSAAAASAGLGGAWSAWPAAGVVRRGTGGESRTQQRRRRARPERAGHPGGHRASGRPARAGGRGRPSGRRRRRC